MRRGSRTLGAFNYPLPDGARAVPVLTGFTYGIFTDDPERQAAAWKLSIP